MDPQLEEFLRTLETLSLSDAAEITFLEPVLPPFQEQPPLQEQTSKIAAEVLQDLDQPMRSMYDLDQSNRFGSNKRRIGSSIEIASDPSQQLFSSVLNQSYVGETSNSINSDSNGESLSQVQFPNVEDSIQFKTIDSSIDIAAANQQLPRKRQRKGVFVKDGDQI
ncbi:unnamed protein product [Microthlaspi erraticum]|uniref:Uncharacterized protein n=1 Tax=Microthlaspi erraticum TaxID=1685480 RepID=A0A6D2KMY2_9BRAS|nr:unnamed protein product [Microthlaspi erraticum]